MEVASVGSLEVAANDRTLDKAMKSPKIAQKPETIGDCAYEAIDELFHKIIKDEAPVLKDKDPEFLHKMRVSTRKLRSTIRLLAPVLDLPKAVNDKSIGKIAQTLGKVRDLDVIEETLLTLYQPNLDDTDQKYFVKVLDRMSKKRRQNFAKIEQMIDGRHYKKFTEAFDRWLAHPRYGKIASSPIQKVLPELLIPIIRTLLQHPGWSIDPREINQIESYSLVIHDLRKRIKSVRYQTELFIPFYDASFEQQVNSFSSAQEVLGLIQDSFVLEDFLRHLLKIDDLKLVLPSLTEQVQQQRLDAWEQWYSIHQVYISQDFRESFCDCLMYPM